MHTNRTERRTATIPEFDVPRNWAPLAKALPSSFSANISSDDQDGCLGTLALHCDEEVRRYSFMHMGRSGRIELYRNIDTGSYLNVDRLTTELFVYENGFYVPVEKEAALSAVFSAELIKRLEGAPA